MNFKMRAKLIIAFIIVALVPLAALAILNGCTAQQALTNDAEQALFAVASQTAASLDAFIAATLNAIETEAQLPTLVQYLSRPETEQTDGDEAREVLTLLKTLSRKSPHIISYALLNHKGVDVVDTVASEIGQDKSDNDYFKVFQSGDMSEHAYVFPILVSETSDIGGYEGSLVQLLASRNHSFLAHFFIKAVL